MHKTVLQKNCKRIFDDITIAIIQFNFSKKKRGRKMRSIAHKNDLPPFLKDTARLSVNTKFSIFQNSKLA